MKVITAHINKGGTGKSTVSFNLARWLADVEKKKVLLVDGDRSRNLSFSFLDTIDENSIYNVFTGGDVRFTRISEQLDFLKGSDLLEDNALDLLSKQNNSMLFYMWIADNYERFEKYDYMIIDTHNDNSLVTYNFLAVADVVLGVSEPSRNGFRAWHELVRTVDKLKKDVIDPVSRKSYINCEPYLIANKVKHIGSSSRQFLEVAEKEDRYLGMIQEKELMRKSLLSNQSIFKMTEGMSDSEYKRHENFYRGIEDLFKRIVELG